MPGGGVAVALWRSAALPQIQRMGSSLALVVWNWFCSSHGKDFCDLEGGALTVSSTALLDVAVTLPVDGLPPSFEPKIAQQDS